MLLTDTLPPLSAAVEPREEAPAVLPPINSQAAAGYGVGGPPGSRRPSMNTELPPIATLSGAGPQEEPPSLAALKEAEAAASRRRTSSAAATLGSGGRRGGGGSKIVACNFCRGTHWLQIRPDCSADFD